MQCSTVRPPYLEVVGVNKGVVHGLGAKHAEVLHEHCVATGDKTTKHFRDDVERRLHARDGRDDADRDDEDQSDDGGSEDDCGVDGRVDTQAEERDERSKGNDAEELGNGQHGDPPCMPALVTVLTHHSGTSG